MNVKYFKIHVIQTWIRKIKITHWIHFID